MPVSTCVFDAYGTLFDVTAAARRAAREPGQERLAEIWPRLAEDWRRKQLEYTWLRAIMGDHTDFRNVTRQALDWALEASGLDDAALTLRLMALYDALDAFPEVPATLAALRARGKSCAILSNGSPDMLASAVASAGIHAHLDAVLSVEDVGVFKPDPRVYQLVCDRLGVRPDQVLFVSSNGWDASAAARFGFHTAWVNRAHAPVDRLPHIPAHVLTDLSQIPDLSERL
ncbi:MAG: haloacid dehalogenase type II [Gemmobacter sp.]|nr:haloacid dehalogenase type II [Gemmobacter sp.]